MHFLLQGAKEEFVTVFSERQEFQGQLNKVNASSYIYTHAQICVLIYIAYTYSLTYD